MPGGLELANASLGMKLAIFDIDGTLTDTNGVDDECYVAAAAEVLKLDPKDLDWSGAPHVTDGAILNWYCQRAYGRTVQAVEIAAVRARFVELLQSALAAQPTRFLAVPGAQAVFTAVIRAGWRVCLATGGWEASARLKLAAAGIEAPSLGLATADDASTRKEILTIAIRRMGHESSYERIVSVGDAIWDVRAAESLGLPFVGIGSGSRSERLRNAGASVVLQDLADSSALIVALNTASVPHLSELSS